MGLRVACLLAPRVAAAACDVAPLGSVEFGSRIRDVEVAADLAYVAAGWQGVAIVDVADPAAMQLVGSLDVGAYVHDVEIAGEVVWAAASDPAGSGGLFAVAVGDPALPALLGSVPGDFSQVELDGDLAYAIDPGTGLHVLDVSDPGSPLALASLDLSGAESGVEVVGGLAYVAVIGDDSVSGIRLVDVSVPTAPLEVGSIPGDDRLPVGVRVDAGVAFVPVIGRFRRGLRVFDLESAGGPTPMSFLAQPNAREVRLLGARAYFAFGIDPSFGGGPGGLRVIDVSDRGTPVVIGTADTSIDESTGLAVVSGASGERAYLSVSGNGAGLRVFEVSACPTVVSAVVQPMVPLTLDVPVRVLLLGSEAVSAADFESSSLAFGPLAAAVSTAPGLEPVLQDENGDGRDDLVVHFQTGAAGLSATDAQACVEGSLAGQPFVACDWLSVDQPPEPRFHVDLGNGIAPLTVTFDGSASFDPEGGLLAYHWQISDGASSDRPTMQRFFGGPTTVEARLTVTDASGQQAEQVEVFAIHFDSDGDGVRDSIEYGGDPEHPVDTDGDGVPDYLDLDSDGDGLSDGEEDVNGNGTLDPVKDHLFETSRTNPDSDGDGFDDGVEARHGTSARDPLVWPGQASLPALGSAGARGLVALLGVFGGVHLWRRRR